MADTGTCKFLSSAETSNHHPDHPNSSDKCIYSLLFLPNTCIKMKHIKIRSLIALNAGCERTDCTALRTLSS